MVVCTKKRNLDDALAYVHYISESIRSKELFHLIDLAPSGCWELLLWKDSANHGGIRRKMNAALGESDE